jgi:hypothetical protein
MHGIGSMQTYAKRYNLCNMFNVAGEEDNDGNDIEAAPKPGRPNPKPSTKNQRDAIEKLKQQIVQKGLLDRDQIEATIKKDYGRTDLDRMDWQQADHLMNRLSSKLGFGKHLD